MDILLGIILFFILFYYGFKLFLKYVLPWLITRFVRKQQSRFYKQQGGAEEKKEGEVRIKKNMKRKPKDDKGFGEYVDYEEL